MRNLLGLILFFSMTFGQGVNDKNFKEKINGGIVVVVFTAEWQETEFDEKLIKGLHNIDFEIGIETNGTNKL